MTVKSIKHSKAKRVLIPSREEAGQESASPKVKTEKGKVEYPVNPVVHRGQDPELFWMHKYGKEEVDSGQGLVAGGNLTTRHSPPATLSVDIRSLYRHEHIAPEKIIQRLYQLKEVPNAQQTFVNGLFGNGLKLDEIDKVSEYYKHADDWTNRLIQGDSLLVMTSLLEREGMAGKVQMIYIDPPYGIKYGSNWQMKLSSHAMKDDDADLSGEPEQIKAYRDTWELGIHSYLSYLRDRLLVAKELLVDSGSCFVQISDENVHLVRCLMDEVFGSENFVSLITVQKTAGQTSRFLSGNVDYVIWYGKDAAFLKYRQLFFGKQTGGLGGSMYQFVELPDKTRRRLTAEECKDTSILPKGARIYRLGDITSQRQGRPSGPGTAMYFPVKLEEREYFPPGARGWTTTKQGMERLVKLGRVVAQGDRLSFVRYIDDFPVFEIGNNWTDTGGATDRVYVVQTATKIIERCLLMATDPGDLVLDPTCGSGTTAFVAEQWGRRWVTIDTSRIALNIAKTRLLTATFTYYRLHDEENGDIRQGFTYEKVQHVTLKSIANDEPPAEETLYDQPDEDKKKLRVSGPFTVETLQNFEPVAPEELDKTIPDTDELENFEERIFEHMKSAGVKNGIRNEQAVFIRVDRLNSGYLHAEGFYLGKRSEARYQKSEVRDQRSDGKGEMVEKKAYIHIGPKFGTVSRQAVNEAVKECRTRGDADWLIILGFSFESNIENQTVKTSGTGVPPVKHGQDAHATFNLGSFEVTKVRMHDDLMQDGLLKRDKKAASFVTIGEPDIKIVTTDHTDNTDKRKKNHPCTSVPSVVKSVSVEIRGLDIYDPVTDEVKARDVADIAYWMVDDDYDGSNFIVRQVFFCGGDKDEFAKWQKGLSDLAMTSAKRQAEKTLKIEIDDDAFARLYGHKSHPIEIKKKGQRIAVRVISQFGEECTKVLET